MTGASSPSYHRLLAGARPVFTDWAWVPCIESRPYQQAAQGVRRDDGPSQRAGGPQARSRGSHRYTLRILAQCRTKLWLRYESCGVARKTERAARRFRSFVKGARVSRPSLSKRNSPKSLPRPRVYVALRDGGEMITLPLSHRRLPPSGARSPSATPTTVQAPGKCKLHIRPRYRRIASCRCQVDHQTR